MPLLVVLLIGRRLGASLLHLPARRGLRQDGPDRHSVTASAGHREGARKDRAELGRVRRRLSGDKLAVGAATTLARQLSFSKKKGRQAPPVDSSAQLQDEERRSREDGRRA